MINTSPQEKAKFIESLTATTADSLKHAHGDDEALFSAIKEFCATATAANMDIEDMENLLGVNEGCIMDLADLSEEDEEIVIDAFEETSNALHKQQP